MPLLSPVWLKVLKYGVPAILLALFIWKVYSLGAEHKANELQLEHQAELAAHEEEIRQLEERIATNETAHRRASQLISEQLSDIREDNAATVAALRSGFALRLRQSDDRAAVYQRLSNAGTSDRADLASHAAELDRSLEQGRLLVGELRSTVAERDGQLRLLGQQLSADRKLINDTEDTTIGE